MPARPSVIVHPYKGQESAFAVRVYLAKELEEQPVLVQEWPWRELHLPTPFLPEKEPRTRYSDAHLLPVPVFEPDQQRLPRNVVAYSRKKTLGCFQCDHIPMRLVASLLKQPGG